MYGKQTFAFLTLTAHRLARKVGLFMLSVFVINILGTAALSASGMAPGMNSQDSLENDLLSGTQRIIICTPQGLKSITLDENGNPSADDKASPVHCVFCLPFHKVVAENISFELSPPVIDLISRQPHYTDNISLCPRETLNASCPPRAPPFA